MTGRLVTLEELRNLRAEWAAQGKVVVLTNGCFDVLHVGHARYLNEARRLGDVLVVGVNDDASVARHKGPERPIVGQDDRAELVASLASVDYVVLFPEDTATALVTAIRPDIYVKGGEYGPDGKELPEAEAVQAYGGRVELLPMVPGRSTTDLIRHIADRYCRKAPGRPE